MHQLLRACSRAKRYSFFFLPFFFLSSQAHACSMAFPAYGIYSGGSFVFQKFLTEGFFLVLAGAVLLKSIAYGFMGKGSFRWLFGTMIAANVVTTGVGYVLEFLHMGILYFLFIPAFLAYPIFYFASKALLPTGFPRILGNCTPSSAAVRLCLLFCVTGFVSYIPGEIPSSAPTHWVVKYVFVWLALLITLLVTTGFEYDILSRLNKKQGDLDFLPVLKANLLVFTVLFFSATGMLIYRGDLGLPW